MSNTTNPIDPRENADTAANVADIQTDTAAAPGGTEPADTADTADTSETSVETHTAPADNGHPVTSIIFRRDNGDAYFAYDTAQGGTLVYRAILSKSVFATRWDGVIRAEFAPRTDEEARNPQGKPGIHPVVMEAVFYGLFGEAHRIMRAAVAAVAHKREAQAEKSRARKARKAAQNAPDAPDAANTNPDTAKCF